jgi:Na+/proline symporter
VKALFPVWIAVTVSLLALLRIDRTFSTPEAHFLGKRNEFQIIAGNISATFGITIFWLLFVFSFKGWGIPSLISMIVGTFAAYLFYFIIVLIGTKAGTFLDYAYSRIVPKSALLLYLSFAIFVIFIEFSFLNIFLSHIYEASGFNPAYGIIATLLIGLFCILFTFNGGLKAVLRVDSFLIVISFALFVIYLANMSNSQLSQPGLHVQNGFDYAIEIFVKDYKTTHLNGLTLLDYFYYGSATFYVFIMFFAIPDFWHRNIILDYRSKNSRLLTIFLSFVGTLTLIMVAYVIAASSRTPDDFRLLHINNVHKDYNVESVINYLMNLSQWKYFFAVICLLIIISAMTSIDSIIIAISAIAYKELKWRTTIENNHVEYYKQLQVAFTVSTMILVCSLIPSVFISVMIALLLAGFQIVMMTIVISTFVLSALWTKFLNKQIRNTDYKALFIDTAIGCLLFIILEVLFYISGKHVYTPLLAICAGIISTLVHKAYYIMKNDGELIGQ